MSENNFPVVSEVIRSRYSVRNFLPDPVSEKLLEELLSVTNRSPSGFNLQPWHFIIVRDEKLKLLMYPIAMKQRQVLEAPCIVVFAANPQAWKEPYEKVLQASAVAETLPPKLIERNRKAVEIYLRTAPFGLYGLAKKIAVPIRRLLAPTPTLMTSKLEAAYYVRCQTMLAASTFMIAATAAGLGTSPMEGFDEFRLKRLLAIPLSYTIPLIVALGYPAPSDDRKMSVRLPLKEKISWDLFGRKKDEL